MSSVFWLIVIGVLMAPFLAYYVAKFAAMGFMMGVRHFHEFEQENKSDGEDKRQA